MLRKLLAALFVVALVGGGTACSEKDKPSPTSENRGQQTTSTSGDVPPGNPSSGETGTGGTNTGGG